MARVRVLVREPREPSAPSRVLDVDVDDDVRMDETFRSMTSVSMESRAPERPPRADADAVVPRARIPSPARRGPAAARLALSLGIPPLARDVARVAHAAFGVARAIALALARVADDVVWLTDAPASATARLARARACRRFAASPSRARVVTRARSADPARAFADARSPRARARSTTRARQGATVRARARARSVSSRSVAAPRSRGVADGRPTRSNARATRCKPAKVHAMCASLLDTHPYVRTHTARAFAVLRARRAARTRARASDARRPRDAREDRELIHRDRANRESETRGRRPSRRDANDANADSERRGR